MSPEVPHWLKVWIDWMNVWSFLMGIAGLALSIWTLQAVTTLSKRFWLQARVPEIMHQLSLLCSEIVDALPDVSSNHFQIRERLTQVKEILDSETFTKLDRKKRAKVTKQKETIERLLTSDNFNERKIREAREGVLGIIEMLSQQMQEALWQQ